MSASSKRKRETRRRQEAQLARRRAELQGVDPEVIQALQITQEQQIWQGPIPSPDHLREYEAVHAGLADRIIGLTERQVTLAEQQQSHRHVQEDRHVRGMNRRADVGLYMAFIIAMSFFAGAAWLIHEGHELSGTFLGSLDLVGLVSLFIYGRWDQGRQAGPQDEGPPPRRRRRRR